MLDIYALFFKGFYPKGVVPSLISFSNRSACAPLNFALWHGAKMHTKCVFQKYKRPSYHEVKGSDLDRSGSALSHQNTYFTAYIYSEDLKTFYTKPCELAGGKSYNFHDSLQKLELVLQNSPTKWCSQILILIPAAERSGFCRNHVNFNGDKLTSCQVEKYF